ncbi:MAG TPA: DNA-processing protein DprA [Sphingomicrobium sp.]|nr:DNA-processing protein DprA [Sphingomicrobium sp.]
MSDLPSIRLLNLEDADYPARLRRLLGKHSPERIFVQGNVSLIYEHSISFCGARDASEKGIDAAALCARTACKNSFVVTSGNARGVDRATHREALENGGATILVLPEGFNHFRIPAELRDVWDWDRVLIVSQFEPRTVWKSYHAMARNKVIMGLSCAMIVVEAGEKGGTRAAGEEALKLQIPLFAVDYGFDEGVAPGNRALIARGAKPLKRSKETGEPNLRRLLDDAAVFCAALCADPKHSAKQPQGVLL